MPAALPVRVTCIGASMLPTVRPGQSVELRPFAPGEARPAAGEVVLLRSVDGGSEILHRLVTRVPGSGYYVHRGDAPGARPGLLHRSRLIARARLAPAPSPLLDRGHRLAQAAAGLLLARLRRVGPAAAIARHLGVPSSPPS